MITARLKIKQAKDGTVYSGCKWNVPKSATIVEREQAIGLNMALLAHIKKENKREGRKSLLVQKIAEQQMGEAK